jgi:ankyrin repeat protein
LLAVSGCGGGDGGSTSTGATSKLTAKEQAEADKYIAEHGKDAIRFYVDAAFYESTANETQLKYLEYLVSKGADIDAKTEKGTTPLHQKNNVIEFVKFFASHGANVNTKNNDGDTPLHTSIDLEVIKFLVSKGADVNAKNNAGETPLDKAKKTSPMGFRHKDIEIEEYLKSVGAK